jgi:hypothetical protein
VADIDWQLLAQAPNAGQAFSDAFQGGMKQNALSAFAMNPNDPNAQGMAARYDPAGVLGIRKEQMTLQAQQQKQNEEDWTKYAGNLAKWADTPDKRDQAIDYLLSHNHPDIDTQSLIAMKNMSDPQWQAARAHFMAAAGVSDDDSSKDEPNIQKEVDYYKSIGREDLATQLLQNHAEGSPIVQQNSNGTVTVYPRSILGGTQATGSSGALPTITDAKGYEALPPGAHYLGPDGQMRVKGGQSGASSAGGFQ